MPGRGGRPVAHLKPDLPRQMSISMGHPWIYSNEIANISELTAHPIGTVIDVADPCGAGNGVGVLNRQASIVVRRLDGMESGADVTPELLRRRMRAALALRRPAMSRDQEAEDRDSSAPYFGRAVNGEQDGLPGIFIDRFGSSAVVTFESVGSVKLELLVQEELMRWMGKPTFLAIHKMVAKKEKWAQDGAEFATDIIRGNGSRVVVGEGACEFEFDVNQGVQGAWHFALEEMRRELVEKAVVRGGTILDAWSHVGQWGVRCVRNAGAVEAVLLEESLGLAKLSQANVARNGVEDQCTVLHRGSVQEELRNMAGSGIRFSCVSLNIRVKMERHVKQREGQFGRWMKPTLKGYSSAVSLGARVTSKGGYLVVVFYLPVAAEDQALSLVKDGLESAGRNGSLVAHSVGLSEQSGLASSAMDDAWTYILVCARMN